MTRGEGDRKRPHEGVRILDAPALCAALPPHGLPGYARSRPAFGPAAARTAKAQLRDDDLIALLAQAGNSILNVRCAAVVSRFLAAAMPALNALLRCFPGSGVKIPYQQQPNPPPAIETMLSRVRDEKETQPCGL